MKDVFGTTISVGDSIVYATMRGDSAILGAGRVLAVNDVKVVMDGAVPKIRIQSTKKNWRGDLPKPVWLSRPDAIAVVSAAPAIIWGENARHGHGQRWVADNECTECAPETIKKVREDRATLLEGDNAGSSG